MESSQQHMALQVVQCTKLPSDKAIHIVDMAGL